jgi:hypothetical protein
MNCSYLLRNFWCCLWGIIFEGSKFQFRKNSTGPTRQCQKSIEKKIIVACPTGKGDAGRQTLVANKCSIVWMPPTEWICIRPGDAGTLTIVSNKCSIVRNAPCRMNMHPPRRLWYTNPCRQQVLHCPKYPWTNEYASVPTPTPFFFPDLSSTVAVRLSFPVVVHMSHYVDSSGGTRARSRVQGCQSSRNHSIGFPLVPCPDCGMARVVEGWT